MSWQEKAAALNALSEITIKMRDINDWYVHQNIEIGAADSSVLTGSYGNGDTPHNAVEDHWNIFTSLVRPQYIVLVPTRPMERRHVRWNGYMWADLPIIDKGGAHTPISDV